MMYLKKCGFYVPSGAQHDRIFGPHQHPAQSYPARQRLHGPPGAGTVGQQAAESSGKHCRLLLYSFPSGGIELPPVTTPFVFPRGGLLSNFS